MSETTRREIEWELRRRYAEMKRFYEDALLRQMQYDAWPWWRKLVWRVFGR
jgi:hypothetical protein